MPSKRKKNKRRMRRVQAQRLALEEQNAANHPVKASPGIAVGAPPSATPKKVAKITAPVPEKIAQAAPVTVPIVETPKVEPKPIVIEPVVEPIPADVEAPKPEPVLVEQPHAEIEIEAHVEVEAEAPAPVIEEAPVIETPPVVPPTVEAAAEFIILETEPVVEAIPSVEAPVVAPSETESQIVDAVVIKTETELTHDVCEPEPEPEPKLELQVEAETLAEEDTVTEVEAEVATTEPAKETTEEPVVEELSGEQVSAEAEPAADSVVTETVVESVMENTTDVPEPEQVIEEVSPAAPAEEEEDEGEVEVLDEEDAAAVPAEPVTAAEDALVQPVEVPVVSETIPDVPVEEAETPVAEEKEAAADILVDDFVVTESASAEEVAISASAAVRQEIETTMDTFSAQMESMDVTFAEPKPAALPAEDVIIDAAQQSGLEMLSEEPKPEICEMPCQMQIPAEPVQLSSAEISMETALNGHIAPEVSIEG